MKHLLILITSLVLFSFIAIKSLHLNYPSYFPKPVYDFRKNPLTEKKVELGRKLFYDPILSKDSSISCASCHSSYNAFAHTDHALSHGISDQIGNRNAPGLFNLAWQIAFMWDGAINHLDMQALAPISHPKEMGETILNITKKLNRNSVYKKLFLQAFNDSIATGELILKSISQFELTLISCESKYDRVKQNKEEFTEQEKKGYELFKKNCNVCHTEPMFTSFDFANNGLPIDTTLKDYGGWNITHNANDSLLFKIPSLRNVAFTPPYMHDGRFKKLSQVLNFYTTGIEKNKILSPHLKNEMHFTSDEKVELISFLFCLSDENFIKNPKFQYPKSQP